MTIVKHEYPILEYDTEKMGIIKLNPNDLNILPELCVVTFFGEVLTEYVEKHNLTKLSAYDSEMRKFPIYKATHKGVELCVVQGAVGAPSIAMMADFLIGRGVRTMIVCGGCGVLEEIPVGDIIIPTVALRDEGTSYHYLPPSREIILDERPITAIKKVLEKHRVPFIQGKTWTTDAFYRETKDMIAYRKSEGCIVVEMECATLAAIARFRGVEFGQLLYSGDILSDFDHYDERSWTNNLTAREKLFFLALETVTFL